MTPGHQGPSPTVDSNGHINPYRGDAGDPNTTDTTVDFAYRGHDAVQHSAARCSRMPARSLGVFNDPGAGGDDAYVPGATVTLYRVVSGVEYLIGTTTTNGSGLYSFTDLPRRHVRGQGRHHRHDGGWLRSRRSIRISTAGRRARPATASTPPRRSPAIVANINFGYWNGGIVTTPVTLAYFKATAGKKKGSVDFEWWTATETGNMGFELYAEKGKDMVRINPMPIRGQDHQHRACALHLLGRRRRRRQFWIVDVSTEASASGTARTSSARRSGTSRRSRRSTGRRSRRRRATRRLRATSRLHGTARRRRWTLVGGRRRRSAPMRSTWSSCANRWTPTGCGRPTAVSGGVYRVTYEALLAAGMDLKNVRAQPPGGLQPRHSRCRSTWSAAASGKTKNLFVAGSYLEFVGEGEVSLYTEENPYRLVVETRHGGARVAADTRTLPNSFTPAPYYMERVTARARGGLRDRVAERRPVVRRVPAGVAGAVAGDAALDQRRPVRGRRGAGEARRRGVRLERAERQLPTTTSSSASTTRATSATAGSTAMSDGAFEVTLPANLLQRRQQHGDAAAAAGPNAGTDEWGDTWDRSRWTATA